MRRILYLYVSIMLLFIWKPLLSIFMFELSAELDVSIANKLTVNSINYIQRYPNFWKFDKTA